MQTRALGGCRGGVGGCRRGGVQRRVLQAHYLSPPALMELHKGGEGGAPGGVPAVPAVPSVPSVGFGGFC